MGIELDAIRSEFLGNGAITMFFRRELFDRAVQKLEDAGYRAHVVDASSFASFQEQMTRALRFKECFGYEPWTGNLDALDDAFREIDYESVTGVVFAFFRFDVLHADDPRTAHHVLDILERASRNCLLSGRQLIGLLQSDDPRLAPLPVGASAPMWNGAEWLDAKRGL